MAWQNPKNVALLAALLVALQGGCSWRLENVRGEQVGTESRPVQRVSTWRLQSEDRLSDEPPAVLVWAEQCEVAVEETRPLYAKVALRWRRTPSLEPAFFLWPMNILRVPAGLAGWGLSALSCGGHYVAAGVGVAIGFVMTSRLMPWTALFGQLSPADEQGCSPMETAGAFGMAAVALLETPLLVLDLPHKLIHGTPLWPVFRNRPEFPDAWAKAMGDSWRFAWSFRTYPPFFIWHRRQEQRWPLAGEVLAGQWERKELPGPWQRAWADSFRVQGPQGWMELPSVGGVAVIPVRALAEGLGDAQVLKFTVEAQTAGGTLSRTFRYRVSDLRRTSAWRSYAP